jgi:hypothetical protein
MEKVVLHTNYSEPSVPSDYTDRFSDDLDPNGAFAAQTECPP